jgi:hypothetical protein
VNGQLAAMIAIALYGNEWLSGADASAHTALDSTNSTFQFVRRFSVHLPGTHLPGAERVGTADALFEWLRKAGTDQLGLVVRASSKKDPDPIPPAIAAAFSNGGQWALVGVGRQNSTWTDQWEVADRDAPDRRIWDVDLHGKRVAGPMDIRSFGVGDSLARLKTALERTHEFAKSNDLAPWTDWFGGALQAASAPDPTYRFHPDIAPAGWLPLERRQLLAAAVGSWVFGGMGSWNDIGFYGRPNSDDLTAEYTEITNELYEAMMSGFVAAVNG